MAKIIAEWPEPSAWNESYQALLVYVDQEGHADVPAKYQSPTGFGLGKWVSQQRTRRRNSQMPESQERRLDRLPGWEWDKQQAAWDRSFEALEQFVMRERHARVPRSHKEAVNKRVVQLGQWVNNQRKANKARALKPLRASRLDSIPGWEWEVLPGTDPPAAGLRKIHGVDFHDELRLFVEEYGHALVPNGYSRPGSRQGDLGLWVAEQREKYWAGNLSLTEKASLDVFAGWAWSEPEADFQTRLHAMRQFLNREGHINVPDDHREDYIGQKIDLASWLTPLLQGINDGDLHSDHYQALALIGPFVDSNLDDTHEKGRPPLEEDDPDELGPYRLRRRIGEGGQAIVYYGESDNGVAAVKVPRPDVKNTKASKERFRREAGVLKEIKSPRVAQYIRHDFATEPRWIAFDYIDGENLDEEHANTKLSYDNSEIEVVALGLARCLADVHEHQIVHRDVKPSNIVMSDNGPVLIDFGIAFHPTTYGSGLTRLPVGTDFYQAPESTQTTARDLYGWANVLLFLKRGYPLGPTEKLSSADAAIKATPGKILKMLNDKTLNPSYDTLFAVTGEPHSFFKHDTGIITGFLTDPPDLPARPAGHLPGDPDTLSEMSVNLYQNVLDSIQSDPEFETVDVLSWLVDSVINDEVTIYARLVFVGTEVRLQMEGIEGGDPMGPSPKFDFGATLTELIVRSLQPDPGLRPTATEIIEVLDTQRAGRDIPTRV